MPLCRAAGLRRSGGSGFTFRRRAEALPADTANARARRFCVSSRAHARNAAKSDASLRRGPTGSVSKLPNDVAWCRTQRHSGAPNRRRSFLRRQDRCSPSFRSIKAHPSICRSGTRRQSRAIHRALCRKTGRWADTRRACRASGLPEEAGLAPGFAGRTAGHWCPALR